MNCSFCGKLQKDTGVLISGPAVNICDECVRMCVYILQERKDQIFIADTTKAIFNELWEGSET